MNGILRPFSPIWTARSTTNGRLANLGDSPLALAAAADSIEQLLAETIELTDGLYQPRYPQLKWGRVSWIRTIRRGASFKCVLLLAFSRYASHQRS